jgi:tetratricopeptide (TPR) repeat protein
VWLPHSPRALRSLLPLVLLVAVPGTAVAQWYRTYDDALQALRRKEWSVAKEKLESSVAEAQRAGRRPGRSVLRYGSLREPFIPDFFLGQAYVGLAQAESDPAAQERYFQEAIKAFDRAGSAQVRTSDPEFAQLESSQRIARAARASVNEAPATSSGEPPPRPPDTAVASARQELQKLIEQGESALTSGSWQAAASTFAEAGRRIAESPALRQEFGQVPARLAEASFAVDATSARQSLAEARFASAADVLERLTTQVSGLTPSSTAARALASGLPRDLGEARAGRALAEADTAFRERRWTAAQHAYENASLLAQGISFSSPRGRELNAQLPGRLNDAKLNGALADKRYVDALAIDGANRTALEGQYALAANAYNQGHWDEAVTAFDALLKYGKNYRDARERSIAANMQVESGLGATADPTNVTEARQHYERVLALQRDIKGSLADSPIVIRAVEQASDRLRQIDGKQGLESARRLYQNGQWDEARNAVNVVLRLLPDDREAPALLAMLNDTAKGERVRSLTARAKEALARGDIAAAGAAGDELRQLVPGNDTAADVLGRVALMRTARLRVYQGIGAAAGVTLIGPILLLSPRRRARFFAVIGRPASALQLYGRVLSKDPTDRKTLTRAADLSVVHGVDAPLAPHFEAYLRARPDDASLTLAAAAFFWSHGDKDRGLALYERLIANATPELPLDAFVRLEARYSGQLPDPMVRGLQQVRRANPGHGGPVQLLAHHYAAVGSCDAEALDVLRAACVDDPANGTLRMSYAKALAAAGMLDAVIAEAGEAARLLPADEAPLHFLAAVCAQYAETGASDLAIRLNALTLPVEGRLVIREALFARNGSLRSVIAPAYAIEESATADPATLSALRAHLHLDGGDTDAALAALDEGVDAPVASPIVRLAQLDAYRRYLAAAAGRGRPSDPALLARVAELYAEGQWWEESVNAWQRTVSVPEWNRRSMAAIEAILDRLSIVEVAKIYFATGGWTATKFTTSTAGPAAFRITPGASSNAEVRNQFDLTPVFSYTTVVTVDDAVSLKREVLADPGPARTAMAFLIATQPIRHDVYALIYAFMTEEPSVTIVPLEARAIREAVVEARSHVHLERTLNQWLGHTDIFETHNPVSNAATFFGRGQFINQLVLKITRRQNFGIFGLRKIGKTSLVYRLRELSRDHLVAYVDLQGVASRRTDEVYHRLLESLLRDLRVKHPAVNVPPSRLVADTPSDEVATSFHSDVMAIRNAFESTNRQLPHVLLLLDEIELMVPHGETPGFKGHQDFFRHIRGLYQQEGFIVSAVVGATPTVCRTPTWDGRDNPVFQFYDEVFLAPLDRQECDQMVQGLGELMGVRFDQASLSMVFEQTAGHPYVARQLCSRLVKTFPERPLDVREEMTVTAIAEYLAQRGDYFAGIVEGYLDNAARRIVETIAVAEETGEGRTEILRRVGELAERHVADQVLGDLELVGLVTRELDRYRLSMPLFRRWLRRSWLDVE